MYQGGGHNGGYQPWRVKISDDGRIFVSSLDKNGVAVWEVSKDLNTWTPVISGTNDATDYTIKKNGNFFAGPNCSMDVIGSGEKLKLLLYSTSKDGMSFTQSGYRLDEYALGTANTFTGTPTSILPDLITEGDFAVVHDHVEFIYDGEGGYWFGANRSNDKSPTHPNLVHINSNGYEDYRDETSTFYGGAGVMVHKGMLFKGIERVNSDDGKFIVFTIGKQANGDISLTEKWRVTSSGLGRNHNEFSVDYAENLYIIGNAGEKIIAFRLPYSGSVTTPAPSQYSYELGKKLNPYAYDLHTTIDNNGAIQLHYTLNADAKRVQVILMDGKKEYTFRDYKGEIVRDGYSETLTQVDINRLNLPVGVPLRWKVVVDGESSQRPALADNAVSFYDPSSVAIDNDPESPYFGRVLVVEAGHGTSNSSCYSSKSGTVQGGVYAFRPELFQTHSSAPGQMWYAPWDHTYTDKCYNGNKNFTRQITGAENSRGYQPWMVRISEDGRIFVSSMDARTDGCVVWEVDPTDLNSWSELIKGDLDENTGGVKLNGNFLAGLNCSMDVKGSGENLKMLLYSTDKEGMDKYYINNYRLHEYYIGQQTSYSTTPAQITHFGEPLTIRDHGDDYMRYAHVSFHAKVSYDGDNGFWFGGTHSGNNSNTDGIVMAYTKKNGSNYTRVLWDDLSRSYLSSGGSGIKTLMINGEKVLVKGVGGNKLRFYRVDYQNGTPILTDKKWDVYFPTPVRYTRSCCNDFAVDHANNLYTVDPHHQKVMTVALPYSGTVTTPAAERYSFTVGDPKPCIVAYNLTCAPNLNSQTYDFSFCANMPATEGKISFHKNDGNETFLAEYAINQQINQGNNTVSIPMGDINVMVNGEMDIIWKLHLRAESSVFGEIYKSEQLNTAYATIDASPISDFFGQIYAANQEDHTFSNKDKAGEIKVWTPNGAVGNIYREKSTITKPLGSTGLELPYRPGVAPDGTVYFTDGGTNGNVYMMNPNDNTVKSFYTGYTQKVGQEAGKWSLFYDGSNQVVGAPSSSAHVYWDNSGVKLFTTRSEIYTATVGNNSTNLLRHNNGYFIYNLDQTAGVAQHTWTGTPTAVPVTVDNFYSTLFTVVGTSHGAWLCQHRRKGKDMSESRSLMFYGNDGERKYVSNNADIINGTPGSGLAMTKDEKTLAMTSGDAGIMLFDITWNGDVPTLTHRQTFSILNNGFITSLNFDYAGNLVATVGDTYNDTSDKHRMVVYAMPKADNSISIPTRYSQRMPALFADERVDVALESGLQSNYQTVDVYRPLVAGMCNTICLPFAIADKAGTPYEKTRIFAFTGVQEGNDQLELQFTEVTSMQAGVPYLIQPESDITDIVRFTNVAPMVGTEPSSVQLSNGVTFHGTINPKDLAVDANYLFLVANNRLATASEGGEMLGLRGYFTVNGTLPSKAIISFREGTATGVTSTIGQTDSVQKILQNQQILIIKGGKTYNVLGTHVK